jgi:hypothetical protein
MKNDCIVSERKKSVMKEMFKIVLQYVSKIRMIKFEKDIHILCSRMS